MAEQHDRHFALVLHLASQSYEAAAEPGLWPDFLRSIARATGSEGTLIWLHDTADSSAQLRAPNASFACDVNFAPGCMASYAAHYTYTNVWLERIGSLPEGALANSSTWYPDDALHRSEFYADWLRPQGLGFALGGPVLKRGTVVAMFSLLRPERLGPYRDEDVRLMQALMPHLRRACLLHQRMTQAHAERSRLLAALEAVPTGVWILDAQGRLLFANRAGRELDARHDGLWIDRNGRPVSADPSDGQVLARIVSETIAAAQGRGIQIEAAAYVRRSQGAVPLHVMVYPLPLSAAMGDGAAAMFITDPSVASTTHVDEMMRLHGLTKTEALLASALARGESLKEYCDTNCVTANTAKTHLKRVLSKTGTHRQAQLVSLWQATCAARRASGSQHERLA